MIKRKHVRTWDLVEGVFCAALNALNTFINKSGNNEFSLERM